MILNLYLRMEIRSLNRIPDYEKIKSKWIWSRRYDHYETNNFQIRTVTKCRYSCGSSGSPIYTGYV